MPEAIENGLFLDAIRRLDKAAQYKEVSLDEVESDVILRVRPGESAPGEFVHASLHRCA